MLTNRSEIRVRYAETDMMGIAYHGSYLPWLEIGRTNALRENDCCYADLEKAGFRLPVLEVNVKYHRPALYDDIIVIETEMREKPILKIRIHYRLTRDDTVIATAHSVHAFINTRGEPVRPPAAFVDAAKRWFG